MSLLFFLAKNHIAAETLENAVPRIKELNSKGLIVTIDRLGEYETSKKEASKATKEIINILETIDKERLNSSMSIKLTAIGLCISKRFCFRNIKKIMKIAKKLRIFIRFDMENSKYVPDTLDIYYRLYKKYKNLGCVIQAYLFRSFNDIENIGKIKGNVRIVKGAYKETSNTSFQTKSQINKSYRSLLFHSLKNSSFTAIATHDHLIIEDAKAFIKKNKIPKSRYEFQMLLGIRSNLQLKLISQGYNVRVYVPFGKNWIGYIYRRMREKKENFWFILRNVFSK
jgi:proline dehydrogenase